MTDLDTNFVGALCEVKTLENQLLLIGTVSKIDRNDQVVVDIVSKNGEPLQLLEYNLRVKVVLRKNGKFLVLGATTFASTKDICRIVNVKIFQDSERRKFFRVTSSAYAKAIDLEDTMNQVVQTHDIKLVDISISGIKFFCEHNFTTDETVSISNLYLAPELPVFELSCKIIDSISVDGGFECRGNFVDLSEFTIDLLCKAIFKLEREHNKTKNKII